MTLHYLYFAISKETAEGETREGTYGRRTLVFANETEVTDP